MPFGLKTVGASFTRAMDLTLGKECSDFVLIYFYSVINVGRTCNTLEFRARKIKDRRFQTQQKQMRVFKVGNNIFRTQIYRDKSRNELGDSSKHS